MVLQKDGNHYQKDNYYRDKNGAIMLTYYGCKKRYYNKR